MRLLKRVLIGNCSLAAVLLASPATAQAGENDANSEESQQREIVVTARKRVENLQDVPSSITVLNGEDLERQGATSLTQYGGYVPSLVVDSLGNPGQARLTLRGIGPIGSGAVVGSYLDDIPVGSSTGRAGARELGLDLLPYDVERLEILRGPQGTLYGASTMGGLIKYVTLSPSLNQVEGRIGGELSAIHGAGKPGWALRGMVNMPVITDRLAVRVTAYEQHTPGFVDHPLRGLENVNDVVQRGARATLLWKPTPNISVKLSALYQDVKSDDPAAVWRDVDQMQNIGDLAAGFARQQRFRQKMEVYSAIVDWELGALTLTSASSFQHSRNDIGIDLTQSFVPLFQLIIPSITTGTSALDLGIDLKKYTQELRLASPSGGSFEWQIGGFYTRERATITQVADARDLSGDLVAGLNPFFDDIQHDAFNEYAGFANVTYKLTETFEINGGIRVARNTQRFDEVLDGVFGFLILPPPGPPSLSDGRSQETVFTYTVGPQIHLSPDVMVYARIAKGYRPGGPNVAIPGIPPQVGSDTLTNYELGVKSEFLDGRMTVNMAVYHVDWDGIQIGVTDPVLQLSYTANASKARSRGVEFEGTYMPVDGLTVGLNGSFNDAKLTSDLPPEAPPLGWQKGDRLPYSARWTASATVNYEFPISANGWKAELGGGYRFTGSRLSDVESSPQSLRLKPYSVVDLNAGISNNSYSARIFVRNLTDARAFTGASLVTDHIEATILQPRIMGISLDARF